MFVVWMLSLSAMGTPCSGPRIFFCARSRSSASASSSAFGFTVMAALSLSSYVPMRTRYCWTSSREVTRCSASAFCMSEIEASTTVKGGGGAFFSLAWAVAASSRHGPSSSRFTVVLAERFSVDDEGRRSAERGRDGHARRAVGESAPGGAIVVHHPQRQRLARAVGQAGVPVVLVRHDVVVADRMAETEHVAHLVEGRVRAPAVLPRVPEEL